MKLEQVMKLIDAGYTKEDIQKLIQAEPAPAPAPAQPDPAPEPAKPADNAVLTELQELRKAVKAMTIVNGAAPAPQEKTVDDILKKLI